MHGNILPKQSVSVRKKTARTVLDQKCFSHIYKVLWNKCVLVDILNVHGKCVSVKSVNLSTYI